MKTVTLNGIEVGTVKQNKDGTWEARSVAGLGCNFSTEEEACFELMRHAANQVYYNRGVGAPIQ